MATVNAIYNVFETISIVQPRSELIVREAAECNNQRPPLRMRWMRDTDLAGRNIVRMQWIEDNECGVITAVVGATDYERKQQ